jgi:hypothetical protein
MTTLAEFDVEQGRLVLTRDALHALGAVASGSGVTSMAEHVLREAALLIGDGAVAGPVLATARTVGVPRVTARMTVVDASGIRSRSIWAGGGHVVLHEDPATSPEPVTSMVDGLLPFVVARFIGLDGRSPESTPQPFSAVESVVIDEIVRRDFRRWPGAGPTRLWVVEWTVHDVTRRVSALIAPGVGAWRPPDRSSDTWTPIDRRTLWSLVAELQRSVVGDGAGTYAPDAPTVAGYGAARIGDG